jgi:[acyl-carrier-protein] S-malonyltransferase
MGPANAAELGRFIAVDPVARRMRRIADDVLGYPLLDRYRETAGDYSEPAVVAFLIVCLALADRAGERPGLCAGERPSPGAGEQPGPGVSERPSPGAGEQPGFCVGASFGQKAAVAYSGALSLADTVSLAVRLTRCENEYFAREHTDVVTQSFARTPREALAEILAGMDERGEWYEHSCEIDEDLHMVSLGEPHVEEFARRLRAAGGLPLYAMRPPVHCAAFGGLRAMAEDAIAGLRFAAPALPIVSDQDGSLVTTAGGVRELVLDYFVRPVRWPAAVATLKDHGVTKVRVSGPDALFGRVGCTVRNFDVLPVTPRLALLPLTTTTERLGETNAISVG